MGLFDFLSGKNKTKTEDLTVENKDVQERANHNSEDSAKLTLNLRKETLSLNLKKHSLEDNISRVAVVMDSSGSMYDLYKDGSVQDVLERILPMAIEFDDNSELDMWLFSNGFKRCKSITENDFYGYVDREIKSVTGGTQYAPVIRDIVKKYVKEEPSDIPTFIIFITDGENSDAKEAEKAITEASHHNIFFKFIGIGDENFKFLKRLDDMEGRFIDNANFVSVRNLDDISDSDLYDALLDEFPDWIAKATEKGIIQ